MKKEIKQLNTDKEIKETVKGQPEVKKDFKKKLKYGGYTTAIAVLLVGIIIVLNIVVSLVETDLGLKVDMTSNKIYTLNKLTEDVIANIKQDLVIYSFADNNKQSKLVEKTLERYAAASSKLDVKVVDPATNPTLQRKFSTDAVTVTSNTIVAANKDETQFRVITSADMYTTNEESGVTYWILEQKLTSALMFLSSDIQTNVYLLSGHGERSDEAESSAVQTLSARLEEENYKVSKMNLTTDGIKLVKGDILMVLGPTGDLTNEEREIFKDFLKNHGKAVFFMNPMAGIAQPNFDAVLDYYMIRIKKDQVMEGKDTARRTDKSPFELVPVLQSHEITDAIINQNLPVYVDSASSVECYQPENELITVTSLMVTSNQAVSVPVEDLEKDAYKEKSYTQEQKCVGLSYKQNDEESILADAQTRIVVYTTSALALGDRQSSLGNMNLVKNSVNWVDNRMDQLYITGTQTEQYTLTITNYNTIYILAIVIIIVIPALTLSGGVIIWRRRKNL